MEKIISKNNIIDKKVCSLCGREISSKDNCFGLICLKKMCNIVGIKKVPNLKKENLLNFKVQLLNWKWFLNKQHKQMLTDRYLTYKILQKIDIEEYKKTALLVKEDTKKITNKTSKNELESNKIFTLKQAFETLEIYYKFIEIKDLITSNKIDSHNIQNFLFDNLEFSFSTYYNTKKYMGEMLSYIQRFFWNTVIIILKNQYPSAMKLLKHSLEDKPSDLVITEGIIIEEIKKDERFINKINEIIASNMSKDYFNVTDSLKYNNSDLKAGLNNTRINIIGDRNKEKWKLDVIITDRYDFTDFKEIDEYENSIFLSTANNCAMISVKSGVIKEYNIKIQFLIDEWGDNND